MAEHAHASVGMAPNKLPHPPPGAVGMLLAKVVGTVVSTRKEASLEGLRFMLCKPVNEKGEPGSGYVVAADAVGSGVGEIVLYATGSSARQTVQTNNRPCDAVIMAIVDNWEVDGTHKYKKGEHD